MDYHWVLVKANIKVYLLKTSRSFGYLASIGFINIPVCLEFKMSFPTIQAYSHT